MVNTITNKYQVKLEYLIQVQHKCSHHLRKTKVFRKINTVQIMINQANNNLNYNRIFSSSMKQSVIQVKTTTKIKQLHKVQSLAWLKLWIKKLIKIKRYIFHKVIILMIVVQKDKISMGKWIIQQIDKKIKLELWME